MEELELQTQFLLTKLSKVSQLTTVEVDDMLGCRVPGGLDNSATVIFVLVALHYCPVQPLSEKKLVRNILIRYKRLVR